MGKSAVIAKGIYLIGGLNVTSSEDATVFIVDFDGDLVMIDAGAGRSSRSLIRNMEDLGLDPKALSTLILTHCHIDHIGSAPFFKSQYGCSLVVHEEDAEAIEKGDSILTAANWYETTFPPTPIDIKLKGDQGLFIFKGENLHWIHTPGHTPGSISLYVNRDGKRILFGQDIHGPFLSSFKSDISEWRRSMEKLLNLKADILCEGHFGIFTSRDSAAAYIRNQLREHG